MTESQEESGPQVPPKIPSLTSMTALPSQTSIPLSTFSSSPSSSQSDLQQLDLPPRPPSDSLPQSQQSIILPNHPVIRSPSLALEEPGRHFQILEILTTNDLLIIQSTLPKLLSSPSPSPHLPSTSTFITPSKPSYGTPLHVAISLCSKSVSEWLITHYCSTEGRTSEVHE